ncbi:MAG: exodeoxyribonuclease VII large subunit [Oscillospiraceae bacterium]
MEILTVSQINRYIASQINGDDNLKRVLIRGEISNFTAHSSGHYYFSLKENNSVIRAVMFRNMTGSLRFRPQNGMKVIVDGALTVYEAGGYYQIKAFSIQPEGLGMVALELKQRKEKLRKEGLFREDIKKQLPFLPETIGVITSPTGAALQDILNILNRRCPIVKVKLFPVLVQGEQAPDSIARAITFADTQHCNVLIVGRGGGSSEDLQAFNAENVAYAIYHCQTPVISAVGHEVDFTIADAVADRRAPTPSAAAELSVPDLSTLHGWTQQEQAHLQGAYMNYLQGQQNQLVSLRNRLALYRPDYRLKIQQEQLQRTTQQLNHAMNGYLSRKMVQYQAQQEKLIQLDPMKILQRGYAAVYQEDNRLLSSVKNVKDGDSVRIRLADGTITAKVESIK